MDVNPVEQVDSPPRHCGYAPCGRELAYDGRGRPPEYCADRRWPGDKTCKQMAASARAAERVAGMDAPLESFRAAGARIADVAAPLARQLSEVVEAITGVRDGALARVGEAEGETLAAHARAAEAQQAATVAHRAQRAAEADRDRARAAEAEAQRLLAQVRDQAEQQVGQAWQRVSEADHARGLAEAAAQAAIVQQQQEAERRHGAEQRVRDLEADLGAVRAELHADRDRLAELGQQLAAAASQREQAGRHLAEEQAASAALRERAEQLQERAERLRAEGEQRVRERDEAHARARAAEQQAASAVADRDAVRADHARLTSDIDRLQEALVAQTRRAEGAEARLDQLIASLPGAGPGAA